MSKEYSDVLNLEEAYTAESIMRISSSDNLMDRGWVPLNTVMIVPFSMIYENSRGKKCTEPSRVSSSF